MRFVDLRGRTFGKLTVVDRDGSDSRGNAVWLCACNCGGETRVVGGNLRTGNTKGCGKCKPAPNKKNPGVAAFNALLSRYRISAKSRDLTWGLSEEDFRVLTQRICFYCGHQPAQVIRNGKDRYVFTGVDRRDPKIGYTKENCVPCCKTCNYAKLQMTEEEFRSYVYRVFTYMFGASNV